MSEQSQEQPFKHLGDRLKTIRQQLHETVADVSGAVEIEEKVLSRIEEGRIRPSEDILMLLISHFNMQDDEAAGLWHLAGYEPPREHDHEHDRERDDAKGDRNTILVMAVDPRVIYSDGVQVHANPNGVVMSFAQNNGTPGGLVTAKIGMSREQARNVLRVLEDALNYSEPRQLAEGEQKKTAKKNTSKQPQNKSKDSKTDK
ncbi:MAG TPA: helix-turn-helix transcriptional regulator [Candidatus Saccharimonadales bacterium]|nr:helix-turn-helix transcriptional regulator [Candidatus Saccharimonadales bacterium]